MPSHWLILSKTGLDLHHTLRDDDGQWQAEAWASVFAPTAMDRRPDEGTIMSVTYRIDRSNNLHLCLLTSTYKIWHTIRFPDGTWQYYWGNVYNKCSGIPEPEAVITLASSVSADNTFQLCALTSSGEIYHTLRNPDKSWQSSWRKLVLPGQPTSGLFGGG